MTAASAVLSLLLAQAAQAAPSPTPPPAGPADQVPAARIVNPAPEDWLTYSGNYQGHRHSPLAQITGDNVAAVVPAWVYQSREAGKVETSPIVVDGVIYITERPHIVTALDGRTGRPLWSHRRPRATGLSLCCGDVNRGPAVLDDALFFATLDARLVALDLRTGKVRWDVAVADPKTGHSMTVAPLAVKDKIIVGISGGEFGIRGFLDVSIPLRAPGRVVVGGVQRGHVEARAELLGAHLRRSTRRADRL